MEHRGARLPEALDGQLVQAERALAPAEDDEHRPGRRKAEQLASRIARHGARAGRDRPSRDPVLRPALALDREREEDALGEGGRQPVRETDMRVGFHQRRRDAEPRCRVDHRAGHVPTTSEHHVGPAAAQDLLAGAGRSECAPERAGLRDARPARQPRDAKRVELVAGVRNEPRLDATRRPGERHACPARYERLRDRQRRRDVADCSPGCDQAPKLLLVRHRLRC